MIPHTDRYVITIPGNVSAYLCFIMNIRKKERISEFCSCVDASDVYEVFHFSACKRYISVSEKYSTVKLLIIHTLRLYPYTFTFAKGNKCHLSSDVLR